MRPVIIAIIKNEHLYLEEWIQYHLDLGFHHIYLFEDLTSRPHINITEKYNNVTLFSVPKEIPQDGLRQRILYNSMMYQDIFKDTYAAFIDIDEFITLDCNETLEGIIQEFEEEPAFGMLWRNFNANGHILRPKTSTIESYKSWEYYYDTRFGHKSFVNMNKPYFFTSNHSVEKMVNTNHEVFKFNDNKDNLCQRIWINHYFTKSWEDWIIRMRRGQISKGLRTIDQFFKYNPDMESVKDVLLKSAQECDYMRTGKFLTEEVALKLNLF